MSIDEDTLNQASTIHKSIFGEVTTLSLLQRIEHLLPQDSTPHPSPSDGPSPGDFDAQIDASHENKQDSCDT